MKQTIKKTCLFLLHIFIAQICAARTTYYHNSTLKESQLHLDTAGFYEFVNDDSYNFNPLSTNVSSPLIKITGSNIDINFNNIGISNQDNTHAGWIGIEIGWTPQELIDDPSRTQPKNIKLENLSLYNFDCGLLIHDGIHNVMVSNITCHAALLGIGVLGKTNKCNNINFQNINIYNDGDNNQSTLSTFKNIIELTYNYGSDYFMPLKSDPLNSESIDVHTYYGICIKQTNKIEFNNIEIKNIGYKNYQTTSEGNGNRTEAIGCCIKQSKRININNLSCSDIFSEIKSTGIQLDNIDEINIKNSNFSYCNSNVKTVGLEVTNDSSMPYSVTACILDKVSTSHNISQDISIGMDLSNTSGFGGYNLTSKFNHGDKMTYGIYTTKLFTADIKNSTFSENSSTRITNDVATTMGITAASFYGENVNSMQHEKVDFCCNQALNSTYGIYLKNSESCKFTGCQFVANTATMMRSGEAAAIRAEQDAQEISMFAPVVDCTSTGGYGAFLTGCKYIKFDDCTANSNKGHRAVGVSARNSSSIALWNSFASTQNSTGQMLDTSFLIDNIANPSAVSITAQHKPLLFGDMTKSTVDMVKATDLFLEKLQAVRTAQATGTDPTYADLVTLLATTSLLQAAIARYRLWGTAMGVHVHNVTGFLLKECTCVGQVSLFDNAAGICFSGRNIGHAVEKCNLSYNIAGYISSQVAATNGTESYLYSYNMIGQKLFWDTILQQREPWTILNSASLGTSTNAVAFSPDSTKLAVGTSNNEIKVYNTSDWSLAQTLTGQTAPVTCLSWSADGTKLASGSSSTTNNIKIWNSSTWIADQTLTHGSVGVNSINFSPDGTKLASGSADTSDNITIWNTSTWITDQTLTHGSISVNSVAFSHDNTNLASGSSDTSNNIKIWNTSTWVADQTLNSHTAGVTCVTWNYNDSLLASGSTDDSIKIWSTSSWINDETLNGAAGDVHSLKFKPDGSLLAAGYANNVVKVWDTASWGTVESTLSDFSNAATSVHWVANGRLLATASSDQSYRVYNTNIFKQASTTDDIGLYTKSNNYKAQDSLNFASTINNNSVFVDLTGTKRPLVCPIGPIAAGLIMGDMMLEGVVQNSYMYANLGNTGHSCGALFNKAFSVTLENNTIAGNNTNAHGLTAGVMDVTAHSPNLYIKNFLEGNKCSTFNNSNYLIPFNDADANGLALPIKKIMNGKFSGITNDCYENIVIEYSQEPEFYAYEYLATIPMHPDLQDELTDNNCWA